MLSCWNIIIYCLGEQYAEFDIKATKNYIYYECDQVKSYFPLDEQCGLGPMGNSTYNQTNVFSVKSVCCPNVYECVYACYIKKFLQLR